MPALTPRAVLEMDALLCLGLLAQRQRGGGGRPPAADLHRPDGSIVRTIGGMDDLRSFLKG